MTYYQFAGSIPQEGTYFIQQRNGHGWTLWHNGHSHLSLHHRDTAQEIEFDTPEALMDYCKTATDQDPRWAYFRERVFRWQSNKNFPDGLGNRALWIRGVSTP
jgi:hypothetical protein